MATVVLSSTLTQYARHQMKLDISGKTLFGVLLSMIQKYPNLRQHLFDINGDLTRKMDFYLNEETIISKRWHNIPVKNSDTISIFLAGRNSMNEFSQGQQQLIPERNESRDRLKLVSSRCA
jgi:hypothetical protein